MTEKNRERCKNRVNEHKQLNTLTDTNKKTNKKQHGTNILCIPIHQTTFVTFKSLFKERTDI